MKYILIVLFLSIGISSCGQLNLANLPKTQNDGKVCLIIVGSTIIASQGINFANEEFHEDKINHFACGYIIGFTVSGITDNYCKNKYMSMLSGIVISSLAGLGKEMYDRKNGGKFDNMDMKTTIVGGIAGSITIRLILGRSNHNLNGK